GALRSSGAHPPGPRPDARGLPWRVRLNPTSRPDRAPRGHPTGGILRLARKSAISPASRRAARIRWIRLRDPCGFLTHFCNADQGRISIRKPQISVARPPPAAPGRIESRNQIEPELPDFRPTPPP